MHIINLIVAHNDISSVFQANGLGIIQASHVHTVDDIVLYNHSCNCTTGSKNGNALIAWLRYDEPVNHDMAASIDTDCWVILGIARIQHSSMRRKRFKGNRPTGST